MDRTQFGRAMYLASDLVQHCSAGRFCEKHMKSSFSENADESFRKLADAMGYDVTPRAAANPAIAAE